MKNRFPLLSAKCVFSALAVACMSAVCSAAAPAPVAAERSWIADVTNAFAVDLYGKLAAGSSENLFFSPCSIETALVMTYAGARGTTAEQMVNVLHLPSTRGEVHEEFGAFMERINAPKRSGETAPGYQLSLANALWGQKGYAFEPGFVSLVEKFYKAGLSEVNFIENAEGAREAINAWVEKQTQDKIKQLIGPGMLTADTRLVLTNAIYFKGNWAEQFQKQKTQDQPFHRSPKRQQTVPLMHRTGDYGYLEEEGFQALKLPYVGNQLSMIILLPRQVEGLAALEKQMTAEKLSAWTGKLHAREVRVFVPRFKMTSQFELNRALASLGMPDAFDPQRADFSGMTAKRDLMISKVVHKAFVDVNEEGTEAAAATGAMMTPMSVAAAPPTFRADHPFLFLIQDEQSGTILFMGRVIDPSS